MYAITWAGRSDRTLGRGARSLNRNQKAAARQLSLAAYLLFSGGQTRDEIAIRDNLPAYASIYDRSLMEGKDRERARERARDALRKQLERDVEALAGVGIGVDVVGEADGRRYRLPPDGFSPLELDLTEEEKAVLVGALRALRRDFPYAQPLHMAVANLIGAASARPENGREEEDRVFAAVVTTGQDETLSRAVARMESAVTRRKRVRFEYYSISSDEISAREVEPYALSLLDGTWYVTGRDLGRDAVRQYRLSRIRGRVTFATKREGDDFEVPKEFERHTAGPRAPWQLGEPEGEAIIHASRSLSEAAITRFPQAFASDGANQCGAHVLSTPFSGERQLAGWILSLGEEVRAVSPPSLVGRIGQGLARIAAAHGEEGAT